MATEVDKYVIKIAKDISELRQIERDLELSRKKELEAVKSQNKLLEEQEKRRTKMLEAALKERTNSVALQVKKEIELAKNRTKQFEIEQKTMLAVAGASNIKELEMLKQKNRLELEEVKNNERKKAEARREARRQEGQQSRAVKNAPRTDIGEIGSQQHIAAMQRARRELSADSEAYKKLTVKINEYKAALRAANAELRGGKGLSGFQALEFAENLTVAAAGVTYMVKQLVDLGAHFVLTAARTEVLDTVVKQVGRTAGITGHEIDRYVNSIKEMGITTQVARQTVAKFVQLNIDLEKGARLARVAQDAAVIGGVNSSEALERLVHGMTTFQPEVLRNIGIMVSFEQVFKEHAKTLGKNVDELTQLEKQEASLNAVLKQGTNIMGTYEASMQDAGKQFTSLPRYFEEISNKIGEVFLPAFSKGVEIVTELSKAFLGMSPQMTTFVVVTGSVIAVIAVLVPAILALKVAFISLGLTIGAVMPWLLAIGVIAVAIGAVAATTMDFGSSIQGTSSAIQEASDEVKRLESDINNLQIVYDGLNMRNKQTAESEKEHAKAVAELKKEYPQLIRDIQNEKLNKQQLASEIQALIYLRREELEAQKELRDAETDLKVSEITEKYLEQQAAITDLTEEQEKLTRVIETNAEEYRAWEGELLGDDVETVLRKTRHRLAEITVELAKGRKYADDLQNAMRDAILESLKFGNVNQTIESVISQLGNLGMTLYDIQGAFYAMGEAGIAGFFNITEALKNSAPLHAKYLAAIQAATEGRYSEAIALMQQVLAEAPNVKAPVKKAPKTGRGSTSKKEEDDPLDLLLENIDARIEREDNLNRLKSDFIKLMLQELEAGNKLVDLESTKTEEIERGNKLTSKRKELQEQLLELIEKENKTAVANLQETADEIIKVAKILKGALPGNFPGDLGLPSQGAEFPTANQSGVNIGVRSEPSEVVKQNFLEAMQEFTTESITTFGSLQSIMSVLDATGQHFVSRLIGGFSTVLNIMASIVNIISQIVSGGGFFGSLLKIGGMLAGIFAAPATGGASAVGAIAAAGAFASGTDNYPGGIGLVGERGRELYVGSKGSSIINNRNTERLFSMLNAAATPQQPVNNNYYRAEIDERGKLQIVEDGLELLRQKMRGQFGS